MSKFRRRPSTRRQPAPTAKWLVTGPSIAAEIKYGRRTTHLLPCKPSHHRRRFHGGQRLSVRAYVGGPSECHVTVTSAERVQLRDVDYPVVRELGYIRLDDFQDAWVSEHDPAWMRKIKERDTQAEAEGLSWGHEAWLSALNLGRFDGHWAHKDVWLIRFAVERALPPRLLAAESGRDGGSFRTLSDNRWQYVQRPEDAEADRGYTSVPSRAPRGEPGALTDDEWRTHIAPAARDREQDRQAILRADRASQSIPSRVAHARDAASVKGLDMRSEFRRYERLVLHERTGDAVRQLELIESRVFPARSAA